MPQNKPQKTPVHYSRRKGSVDINGDPADVKVLVFVDLLLAQVWPMILTIILLFLLPKASLLPLLWQYLKSRWLSIMIFMVLPWESVWLLSG